jgi:hypothetical protein
MCIQTYRRFPFAEIRIDHVPDQDEEWLVIVRLLLISATVSYLGLYNKLADR